MLRENRKDLFKIVIISSLYYIFVYTTLRWFSDQNILYSVNDLSIDTLKYRIILDIILFLPVLFLMVIKHKNLDKYYIKTSKSKIVKIMLLIYILFFFIHQDFSISGYYRFVYFLIFIGFGEEFIFRAYIYNELQTYNRALAVIYSGILWGLMYSILAGLISNDSFPLTIAHGLIGGGLVGNIVFGLWFIYLMERSQSILVPALMHAILCYQPMFFGIIVAFAVTIYLYNISKDNIEPESKDQHDPACDEIKT